METLLIVLVIGCALAFVVQVGRGIWARARTVERHQQALDTLAGLTQRPEESEDSFGGPYEHQAHVRLIGPGSQGGAGDTAALPPPRALPSSSSPYRRTSYAMPPTAVPAPALEPAALEPAPFEAQWGDPVTAPTIAVDAAQIEAAAYAGPETGPVLPVAPPPPSTSTDLVHQTMPGLPPPPAHPAVFVEPPTVPVPIVQPQVFYFDDLSAHGEAPDGEGRKSRRLGRRRHRSDVTAEHMLPAVPPPPAIGAGDKAPAGGGGPKGGRKSVIGVVLAAAAICVAVAAIGLTIVGLPGQSTPGAQNADHTGSPSSTAHHDSPTSVPSSSPSTTAPPTKPAVLVSSQNGTATYELSSASASIVVSASGPCWLEVRANSPLGQIVYEGTLEAGVHFSVTGPAWIRLGNPPAVAVKVNGTPMTVPGSQLAVPVNLQFSFG